MPITPDSLTFTDKDFSALRRRLFLLVQSTFTEWTDFDEAAFNNILVELFARAGEVLTFYQDRQANESRIVTALLRKSVLAHGKLIGFKAPGAIAARCPIKFSNVNTSGVPTAAAADIVIPAGTVVKTNNLPTAVLFELLEDLTIPAGSTHAYGLCENSTFVSEAYVSTNQANQSYRLSQTPFLDGSLVASAGNGAYSVVDSFVSSSATSRDCTVSVDENVSAVVRFGTGIRGVIPLGTITFEYRTWGGLVGRLATNTITRIEGSFTDVAATPVRIVVTNDESTTVGIDRPTVGRLRELIPLAFRMPRAAVAREDYEIGALLITSIARALHLTSNEDVAIGENEGFLFLLPADGQPASQTLIDQVMAQFFNVPGYPKPPFPSMSTYRLSAVTALRKVINVTAKIFRRKQVTGPAAKASVMANLNAFFNILNPDGTVNQRINFGFYLQDKDGNPTRLLAYSDVFNEVRDASGVLRIGAGYGDFLLNGLQADVELELKEFPQLGTVVLIDGDTSQEL
ncbi:t4-like baseplate wedge [Candidatus Dependentiae bacterium]|nr:MAG: t4-like baseplate wedge [Candidatus Dependentiae bacterium]